MWVKKYEASTLEEALALVKKELGPEALILSTQQVTPRWFGKSRVEVMAGKEEPKPKETPKETQELDEEALNEIFPHRRDPERTTPPRRARTQTQAPAGPDYLEGFKQLGFTDEAGKELVRRLVFDYPKEDRQNPAQLERIRARVAVNGVATLAPTVFGTRPLWTALGVGGSGKTSLLVKMAVHLRKSGTKVTLVGSDRRKVTAHREMATYARLIQAGFSTQCAPQARGIQLVDTPALALGDDSRLEELRQLCRGASVVLVLDATCRLKEMRSILERARQFEPSAVALTRLDLVAQPGPVIEALKASRLPLIGASLDDTFRTPFKFFEQRELGEWVVSGGRER